MACQQPGIAAFSKSILDAYHIHFQSSGPVFTEGGGTGHQVSKAPHLMFFNGQDHPDIAHRFHDGGFVKWLDGVETLSPALICNGTGGKGSSGNGNHISQYSSICFYM